MADELRDAHGVEAKLVAGSGGIFEVLVDGKDIFNRSETRRFPKQGEIAKVLSESSNETAS